SLCSSRRARRLRVSVSDWSRHCRNKPDRGRSPADAGRGTPCGFYRHQWPFLSVELSPCQKLFLQPFADHHVDVLPDHRIGNLVGYLSRKSVQHHGARGILVYSPCPKVKERFFIQLAGCTAVRTLHIIGPDLKLRL